MGKEYEHNRDYRRIEIGKHIVFYKEREGGVFVTRILNEDMDVERILQ